MSDENTDQGAEQAPPAPAVRMLPPDPSAPPASPAMHAECGEPRWDGVRYVCPLHGVALAITRDPYQGANRPGVHRKAPPVVPPTITRAKTSTEAPMVQLQTKVRELEATNERLRAQLETTQAELREAILARDAVPTPDETPVLVPDGAASDEQP